MTDQELQTVTSYVKDHLPDLFEHSPSVVPLDYLRLAERVVRVEEGLLRLGEEMKNQNLLAIARFEAMDKQFEAVQSRFEAMNKQFEMIQKQFEVVQSRFEAMNRQFEMIQKQFEAVQSRFEAVDRRFDDLIHYYGQAIRSHGKALRRNNSPYGQAIRNRTAADGSAL